MSEPQAGGSYEIRDGKRVLVERTEDHPEGNRPRAADGRPIDAATGAEPAPAAPPPRRRGNGKDGD